MIPLTKLPANFLRERLQKASALCAGLVMLALLAPTAAKAADPPFTNDAVSLSARGQNVRDFVADLFSEAGLRAKISTQVRGQVQGVFQGPPSEIWGTISRAYGLVAYFDGSIVRIYANSEIASRSIPTFAGDQLVAQANQLRLTDPVNTARVGDGLVLATGVPSFLDRLESMAGQLSARANLSAKQTPAVLTTGANTVASPLLRAPLARASVRSEVIRNAGRGSPFEVRIFYLKYRDAADREVRSSDRAAIIPGVATLLQEQMGDGTQVGGVSSSATNERSISGLNGLRDRRPSSRRDLRDFRDLEEGEPAPRGGYGGDGPRISADPTVNAVIVRDVPSKMGVYQKLIDNLDIEPLMVETQVTILELNHTKLKELGLDFGFGLESLGLLFGGGPSLGPGGITGGYLTGDGEVFLARIKALEQRGAVRTVTRPVLSSVNNQVATFDITTQQVVRLQGEREVDAFSVNYGLAMRIRPSAIEDGGDMRIRMQLEISNTELNGLVVDGIPTAAGPRIQTQMIVRQGESVMLAGMTRTTEFDRKQKTPVLGDIPGLGQLFRKRRKGEDHIERLFLLTPRISNLGSSQIAPNEVEPLTLEQLRGTEPVKRKRL
ncbi:secretin N-terminal domain-containing protein [Qipengyuania sp. DGS5-3]|uniref:secretin N-terminal domain-containing protein n=1 Tax=Qipengyuania sp. DGS5-3 TaxID=3349632 RepID=UPI0036D39F4F